MNAQAYVADLPDAPVTDNEEPAVPAQDPEPKVSISQLWAVNFVQMNESLALLGNRAPSNKIDNINWRIALAQIARDLTIYDADARRVTDGAAS